MIKRTALTTALMAALMAALAVQPVVAQPAKARATANVDLSLIPLSEPTRRCAISCAVFCLGKNKGGHGAESTLR